MPQTEKVLYVAFVKQKTINYNFKSMNSEHNGLATSTTAGVVYLIH